MPETISDLPPSPPPPRSSDRRLARDPDDRVVAGVCAAFGRYTDTDPVLWRVAVAVLAVFGGAGIVLYGLGWLLVPKAGQAQSALERAVRRSEDGLSPAGIALVVVVGVVLLGLLDNGPGLGVVLVLAVIGYLVLRERRDGTAPASAPAYDAEPDPAAAPLPYGPPPPPATYGPATYGPATYGPATWSDGGPAQAAPDPEQERSALGVVTVSAAALLTGLLLALRALGVEGITVPRTLAAALLVVGAGLLVGTWWGRARWLIAVGLVLAVALGVTAATRGAGLDGGFGERRWVVSAGSSQHSLGAGEGVLDLTRLERGDRAAVRAEVGFGQLTVLVPDDVVVDVAAEVGYGEITEIAADGEQLRRSTTDSVGAGLRQRFTVGGDGRETVRLDLEVGAGEVVVRHVGS